MHRPAPLKPTQATRWLAPLTVLLTAVALGTLALAGTSTAAPSSSTTPTLRVTTASGALQGELAQGSRAFLGVPFAAPPVNERRFAAPQPVASWSGVRDATKQGPACVQFQPTGVRNEQATSEDCLYLDVYTPPLAKPGSKLPIVLFIHGGGSTQGSGVLYGGQRFSTLTNSIFVSINYRLGAYGSLALPQLDGNGDFAFLDQLAALKWMKGNATAFGGDPGNITIDGQSAGSMAVCNMLASPMAKGLFQGAILESTPCNLGTPTLTSAQADGQKYATAAGCPDPATVVACLRSAWTPNLVATFQTQRAGGLASGTPALPLAPKDAIAAGKWNKVPVIVGSNRWEYKLQDVAYANMTADEYTAAITNSYGANAPAVLWKYPLANYDAPFYAYAAVGTDANKACASYALASTLGTQVATFQYEFDDPTSPTLFGFQPPGIDMSSAHSGELAYLWNFTLGDKPLTSTQLALGKQMDRYWGAFATTGNPAVRSQVVWPAVTSSNHPVIGLHPTGNTVSTTVFQTEHNCAFWSRIQST